MMDKTQAVAFCEYAIGERAVGGAAYGGGTKPCAPELRAFVVSRLGDLMPAYCYTLHPASQSMYDSPKFALQARLQAKAFADLLREVADAIDPPQPGLWDSIDVAHIALRMVDASDTTSLQPCATLDAVASAVGNIERIARETGHILPEFRPMRVSGGAQS